MVRMCLATLLVGVVKMREGSIGIALVNFSNWLCGDPRRLRFKGKNHVELVVLKNRNR